MLRLRPLGPLARHARGPLSLSLRTRALCVPPTENESPPPPVSLPPFLDASLRGVGQVLTYQARAQPPRSISQAVVTLALAGCLLQLSIVRRSHPR